jgi:hypothetical protein
MKIIIAILLFVTPLLAHAEKLVSIFSSADGNTRSC